MIVKLQRNQKIMDTNIVIANPTIRGIAVRFTISSGETPINDAAKIMTAAAGDIVRPNAEPSAPNAPRSMALLISIALIDGNTPFEKATLGAVPDPEMIAIAQTERDPMTCANGPACRMNPMMLFMNPIPSSPAMKQFAAMMRDIT